MPPPSRTTSIWRGIVLGTLWTFAFVGVASVVHAIAEVPHPAYELFEWITRRLPGAVVTFAIDLVVTLVRGLGAASTADAAKIVEKLFAIGFAVGAGAVVGAAIAALGKTRAHPLWLGCGLGALAGALYVVIVMRDLRAATIVPSLFGFVAWGGALGATILATARRAGVASDRRAVVTILAGAAVAVGAVALGVTRMLTRRNGGRRAVLPEHEAAATTGSAKSPSAEALSERWSPVPGTRPELTANADFYRVDINLAVPSIDDADWQLVVAGLVAKPLALSLAEIRSRPRVSQIITLECISNPVGGDLIGTSRWTGIRLAALLDEVGVTAAARAVAFEAADGFHESASLADARDPRSLLVYEMNGEPLPEEHGFPLRLYIPDRHGMKLPKWITRIQLVAEPRPGYWVERGWSATAIPHTTSVIDVAVADGRTLEVGGIAYAGARGIARVEVQIDGGAWSAAQLRTPALSPLTWVQWRYRTTVTRGRHVVRVRAFDGTGAPQDVSIRPPHPDGATGIHERSVRSV